MSSTPHTLEPQFGQRCVFKKALCKSASAIVADIRNCRDMRAQVIVDVEAVTEQTGKRQCRQRCVVFQRQVTKCNCATRINWIICNVVVLIKER